MSHILHISDHNLLLQRLDSASFNAASDNDTQIARSQGYAWLKDDKVLFDVNSDDKPVAHCRIAPQQINSRYWQQCAQTAIASNDAGMRHAADLIWKHLAELKAKYALATMAMVVPANYRDSHLQLLLGVAKATGLDVSALISKPVLAAQTQSLGQGYAVHVDIQLHETVISTLEITDEKISLVDVDVKPELGIHSLQESLLHALQANFIRTDRFDPLHDADTEQQLFNQLPEIVASAVKGEKSTVGVQHQGKLYSTVIASGEIESALSDLISQLNKLDSKPLLVDTNASFNLHSLPSLTSRAITWVNDGNTLAAGLLLHDAINTKDTNGNVVFQTSLTNLSAGEPSDGGANAGDGTNTKAAGLPVGSEPSADNSGAAKSAQSSVPIRTLTATHLMQFGLIVPISLAHISTDGAVLVLTKSTNASDVNALLKDGKLQIVNDQERTALLANDRIMSPLADGVITAAAII